MHTKDVDGIVQGGQPVKVRLSNQSLGSRVGEERAHLLSKFADRRAKLLDNLHRPVAADVAGLG